MGSILRGDHLSSGRGKCEVKPLHLDALLPSRKIEGPGGYVFFVVDSASVHVVKWLHSKQAYQPQCRMVIAVVSLPGLLLL